MRIEKTDMEFVTFDAQDVILTSTTGGGGGSANAWFIGASSLLPGYEDFCDQDCLSWEWPNGTTNESVSLYINGTGKKFYGELGVSYQLTENSYYQTNNGGNTYIFEASELSGTSGTGTQLTTLDEITGWLTSYAKGKQ